LKFVNPRFVTVLLATAILLILPLNTAFARASASQGVGTTGTYPNKNAYIWYFGYEGDEFQPQTQLGVTPANMISYAASICAQLEGLSACSHPDPQLVLIHTVGEASQQYISTDMIPTERAYVQGLRLYAGVVSGWLDLSSTNLTSSNNVYQEVSKMVNDIGVNAIWFDHSVAYYSPQGVGKTAFDQMMTTLHIMFPGLIFFLNVTDVNYRIYPPSNSNWAASTYVLPSLSKGFVPDINTVIKYNEHYPPGHVILHFDATAEGIYEPMGRFANFTAAQEYNYVNFFLGRGLGNVTYGYNLLVPIMGGPTCICQYGTRGNLYNGLPFGFDSRGTAESFVGAMQKYNL
jgi:hypothetical protein